jgi:septal ring factor EnvC (AmiA/AmiB activator)
MSLENPTSKRINKISLVEDAIDILGQTKDARHALQNDNQMDAIKTFSPKKSSNTRDGEFSEREKTLLRDQLQHVEKSYRSLMVQYDELYSYCEVLLKDSENRRKALENDKVAIERKNADIINLNERMAKEIAALGAVRIELDSAIQKRNHEIGALQAAIQNERNKNAQVSEKLETSRYQEGWMKNRIAQMETEEVQRQMSAERSIANFNKSLQTIDELCQSVMVCFGKISNNGDTALTPKAGKILVEQLRLEIANIRKIQPLPQIDN